MTAVLADTDLPHNAPRRPKTRGIGPLGMMASCIVGAGLIIGTITVTFVNRPGGVAIFLFAGIFFVLAAWKDIHHRGPLEKTVTAVGWSRQYRAGYYKYQPGALTVLGDYRAPGTSAMSQLSQGEDVFGHSYGMLSYPQTGHHVINIKANPDGSALADTISMDQRDAQFAHWLAELGNEPGLEQVAITMEIAPDAHPALQRWVSENSKGDGTGLGQQALQEMLEMYPQGGTATSQSYITMTFRTPDGTDKAERKADAGAGAMRDQLSTRLPDLLAALPATGAGAVTLMTAEDVVRVVRCAYNPGDRAHYQELLARGEEIPVMGWQTAGPAGADESKGFYEAGDGLSITWETTGFTGSQVASRAMKPIVKEPPKGVHTLRVCWLYKPISPDRTAFIAEADHKAAKQRAKSIKQGTARDTEDVQAANRTRHAEANGKGLINYATLVTATVLNEDDGTEIKAIKRAKSGIEHVGPAARLRLRVMRGSQAAAFAQALGPLGLVTSAHLLIPTAIRKAG